jgi:hypothetical protein
MTARVLLVLAPPKNDQMSACGRHSESMYIGGGVVGIVVIVLIVLFVLGRL